MFLKEILHELDAKLTDQELDGIIDEIDCDCSGTVDFDGKCFIIYMNYRVTKVVAHFGWVDLDLECFTILLARR